MPRRQVWIAVVVLLIAIAVTRALHPAPGPVHQSSIVPASTTAIAAPVARDVAPKAGTRGQDPTSAIIEPERMTDMTSAVADGTTASARELGSATTGSLPDDGVAAAAPASDSAAGAAADRCCVGPAAAVPAIAAVPPPQPRAATPADAQDVAACARFADWARAYAAHEATDRPNLAVGEALARARHDALARLIVADPRLALAQGVPLAVRATLPQAISRHLEQTFSTRATLQPVAQVGGEGPAIGYRVALGDRDYAAYTYGRRADGRLRRDVAVHGIAIGAAAAVDESPVRPLEPGEAIGDRPIANAGGVCPVSGAPVSAAAADVGGTIHLLCGARHVAALAGQLAAREDAEASAALASSSWTEGVRSILYIRVRFANQPADYDPQPASDCDARLESLRAFWQSASYGKLTCTWTVTPVLTLPHTEAEYDTWNYGGVRSDAIAAAAAAGYDAAAYDLECVRYDGIPGQFAGAAYVGRRGCWLKASSDYVLRHELGHNLGLLHAGLWYSDGIIGGGVRWEYGDPFDPMGSGTGTGDYNERSKSLLGWLPAESVHVATGSGAYTVYPFDAPTLLGPDRRQALRVPFGSGDYWVEVRRGVDNEWLRAGVSIRWVGVQGDCLLDATPHSLFYAFDSPWIVGRTFADPANGIYITPTALRDTSPPSIDVVVNRGTFADNHPPRLALRASANAVRVNELVTFTADASDDDGDALSYAWEWSDARNAHIGPLAIGSPTMTTSFAGADEVRVACTVSDRKGGSATRWLLVRVGDPLSTPRIAGHIHGAADGVEGVLIATDDQFTRCTSDSDGAFVLVQIDPSRPYTITPAKAGWRFTPASRAAGDGATDVDFVATRLESVSIEATDATASEDGDTGTVVVSRTQARPEAMSVHVMVGAYGTGYARWPADFTLRDAGGAVLEPVFDGIDDYPTLALTIPSGASSASFTVVPTADNVWEDEERAAFSIRTDASYNIIGGPATVVIAAQARPANDRFADRIAIGGARDATVSGTNVGAGREPGEPAHGDTTPFGGVGGFASVWYAWTAPTSGATSVTCNAALFTPITAVYTGASVDALTLVGTGVGSGHTWAFDAVAGTTYAIAVAASRPEQTGPFSLAVRSPNAPPIARIAATPTTGEASLRVAFDGGASTDVDGTIVTYAWTFGDGTSAEGATASHVYDQPGTYQATLTVIDDSRAVGSATTTIIVSARPHDSGLLARWAFDEGAGATAKDGTSGGHDAAIRGGAWTAGKVGQALRFAGGDTGASATLPAIPTAPDTSASVAFWMRWDGADGGMPIGFAGQTGYDLWMYGGSFGFNTGNSDIWGMPSADLAGRWVHVVACFANGDAQRCRLFVDGIERPLSQRLGSPGIAQLSPALRISGWPFGGYGFAGTLDEVRVYDHALTVAEVTDLYHSYEPPVDDLEHAVIAAWSCDEGTGAVAHDASGNGYAATLSGATWTSGRNGSALGFSGGEATAAASIDAIPTADGSAATVEFWMRWDGTDDCMPIGFGGAPAYDLWLYSGSFGFNTAQSDLWGDSSAGLANRWVHVVATFANGDVQRSRLFIDGVERPLSQRLGAHHAGHVSPTMRLSGWPLSGVYGFHGAIDEVRVYDRALTPAEVASRYQPPGSDLATALLAAWALDEGGGATARDASGHGHDASVAGATWTDGRAGTALRFAGGDATAAASIATIPTADGTVASVECWMYWDGSDDCMPIGFGGVTGYDLWLRDGSFGFNTGNSDIWGMASAGLAGRWVHVVAAFANGDARQSRLFIDGVEQRLSQRFGSPGIARLWPDLRISGWPFRGYGFHGAIDEVRVYDRALTADEVAARYGSTPGGGGLPAPRVLADWHLDESRGATAIDASGRGHDGTIAQAVRVVGTSGGALRFAGGADSVAAEIAELPTADGTAITVEFWMLWDGTEGGMPVGFGQGGLAYDLWFAGGAFGFNTGNSDVRGIASDVGRNPAGGIASLANRWVHVIAVFVNGDATASRLFIDGEPQSLMQRLGTPRPARVSPAIRISGWPYGGGYGFHGDIDEMRVYDRALTDDEARKRFLGTELAPTGTG